MVDEKRLICIIMKFMPFLTNETKQKITNVRTNLFLYEKSYSRVMNCRYFYKSIEVVFFAMKIVLNIGYAFWKHIPS